MTHRHRTLFVSDALAAAKVAALDGARPAFDDRTKNRFTLESRY